MKPRAITPLFRWIGGPGAGPAGSGMEIYPAPVSGSHSGEAWFLALGVFALTATLVVPWTAGITHGWVRWPLVGVLLFILPQLAMAAVSLVLPRMPDQPGRRESAQGWGCLAAMTLYAAAGSSGDGWEVLVCRLWLGFVLLNLPFLLMSIAAARLRKQPGLS